MANPDLRPPLAGGKAAAGLGAARRRQPENQSLAAHPAHRPGGRGRRPGGDDPGNRAAAAGESVPPTAGARQRRRGGRDPLPALSPPGRRRPGSLGAHRVRPGPGVWPGRSPGVRSGHRRTGAGGPLHADGRGHQRHSVRVRRPPRGHGGTGAAREPVVVQQERAGHGPSDQAGAWGRVQRRAVRDPVRVRRRPRRRLPGGRGPAAATGLPAGGRRSIPPGYRAGLHPRQRSERPYRPAPTCRRPHRCATRNRAARSAAPRWRGVRRSARRRRRV